LTLGHGSDLTGMTGVTVILAPQGALAAAEVRGSATGTRQFDSLVSAQHVASRAHAFVLAGGSGYGLAAADPVVEHLAARGFGFQTGIRPVPLVPTAILFDLAFGSPDAQPTPELVRAALDAAAAGPVAQGSVGAGTGATVGKLHGAQCAMRGGLGWASTDIAEANVAAIVAVNAVGDVRDPATGHLIAGARETPESRRFVDTAAALAAGVPPPSFQPVNTTIGVVVTTAALGKAEAARIAHAAMEGLARALSPPHLDTDGDTLFCLSVGDARVDLAALGRAAADVVAGAIVNGVLFATSLPGLPAARDLLERR